MLINRLLGKRSNRAGVMIAALSLLLCGNAYGVENPDGDPLNIENGTLMPVFTVSDLRAEDYTNEESDILRYCVYVETDNDTDNDGFADLVKVLVQVPRAAAEGHYKAGTIYDPTPYNPGTYENENYTILYNEEPFDYEDLYRDCEKRESKGEMSTLEAAALVRPEKDWNYMVPISGDVGYRGAQNYDYYLARGYAVVEAGGIGTYGSEGFELCSTFLERDSHKAVVEWLTGKRRAFTDKANRIEIRADWSNGKVAMTGVSYGGTIPFEVATTGVEGLETIIPIGGIASWYDYTNSQGVPLEMDVNYADYLAAGNCGGTFLDEDWTVSNKEYGSWLWQIAQDQAQTNGNYGWIWEESDYSDDWEKINCSALVVQGLNDYNVTSRHADLMAQAFEKAGKPVHLVLHQDGHNDLMGRMVNGELWEEILNRWLAHYLYGVENDAEQLPSVLAQSNVDGSWNAYDTWRDFNYLDLPVFYEDERTVVTSEGLAEAANAYIGAEYGVDHRDAYYISLSDQHAAYYSLDLPENSTIYGVPEINVRLSTDAVRYEGLMITAVLLDVRDDEAPFDAFMLKDATGKILPVREIGEVEGPYEGSYESIKEYVQDRTIAKTVSFGWTDLADPGRGPDSKEYAQSAVMQANEFYDYTFYMQPTVYTVAPGHHLILVLTTWDPYRVFLDESFENLDFDKDIDYDYSFVIDNSALQARMPVAE